MPVEPNPLMNFLEQVENARRRRQQEAQEQAPAAPEMPEWSKRLNPEDFTGATRDMLMAAQSAAPGTANQMGKGGLDLMPPPPDDAVRGGIGQVMEEEQQRIQQRQQPAPPMPPPMDPGVMRDPNRPQQSAQPQMPEPAAEMPQQQNPAPAAPHRPQGGQPANLRQALGPYVGGPGDFVAMTQRARQTGELPGGSDISWAPGDAPSERSARARGMMAGSGGSDRLAQPTAARGGSGLFGGSGPGLGYAIGGIGALLQEASGQQGAASRFAQTYGGQFQERREANQTRQLALQLGIPEEIVANAPMNLLTPMIADTWKRKNAGTEYKYVETPEGIVQIDPTTGKTQLVHQSAPQPKSASLATLQMPDGTQRTFDLGNPDDRAIAQRAMSQGATEVRTPATQVNIGTGDQTAGQKKADEAFGDEYQSWVTGGFADVQSQIAQLDEVASVLESGAELSGPAIGIAYQQLSPDLFAAQFPEAQAALDNVSEIIQRSLRETLGAQMAEQEAERFIARAYNMSLPPQENAKRVRRAVEKLRDAAAAKSAAVDYFGEQGTLTGFDYKAVPSALDTAPPATETGGQQRQAPAPAQQPKRLRFNPETGQLEQVQ